MPTPVRVFYGADGMGDCPLTVRDGRNWLSREFTSEPVHKTTPAEVLPDEIENPALSLKEMWFRYEKDSPDILRGVSAEVPVGSLYAIVGGNGAGKSTTLKAICGICRPYRGSVKVFGKPVNKYKSAELFGGCLAMLPQDPKSLFVKKTVREDLEEMSKDKALIGEIAATCQIEKLLDSHPYDLSGGEQQRAALAKVLLTQPKLLLLDEPTKGIDSFFKETFAKILKQLQSKGITIVMVSHDVEFCAKYADMVSMFFDGQMLTTDTPRRFFGNNSFYTTAANRMSRHVFDLAVTAENVVSLYKQNKEGSK
jgi:energy-coupling factor transport system ATP-binding protein